MVFVIGSDPAGKDLKEIIIQFLSENSYEVIDVTGNDPVDFVDASVAVVREVRKSDDCYGIIVDAFGAGPFMTVTRIKGVIAAEVSDERTAYMTRSHNNARIITLGSEIIGPAMAKNIVKSFAEGSYDGGRHQVRVDMLNHMGKEIMLEETE
ncbi:MAG: galactose-6-phosphate isomerase subunit LacA [Erysipelotrichaceae bacterium]|nr:galactose-6-phosphate isomerase subunit LacA [Erysipelotrichaceae bacterium]